MNSSTRGWKALPELTEERVPSSATSAIRRLRHCLLRYPFVRQWKSSPEPVCQQQSGTVTSSQSQAVVERGHCQKVCSKVVTRGSLKEPGEGTIDLLMLMQSDKWGACWLGNREKGSASSWAGMQCILHSPQKVRKSRNAFLLWSNRLRLRSGKGSTQNTDPCKLPASSERATVHIPALRSPDTSVPAKCFRQHLCTARAGHANHRRKGNCSF